MQPSFVTGLGIDSKKLTKLASLAQCYKNNPCQSCMYDKEKGKGDEGEIHKTEVGECHPSHATVPYPCLWMS